MLGHFSVCGWWRYSVFSCLDLFTVLLSECTAFACFNILRIFLRGKLHLQNVKLIKNIKSLLQIYARLFISKNISCHWDYLGPLHIFFQLDHLQRSGMPYVTGLFINMQTASYWPQGQHAGNPCPRLQCNYLNIKKNTHNYQVKLKLKPQVFVTKPIPIRQYVGET